MRSCLRLRSPAILLALLGALLLGGCTHPTSSRPPTPTAGSILPPTSHRLFHVYVDCALPTETSERNHALAETLALTLRDQLRQHGFDVRGAEATGHDGSTPAASQATIAQLGALARAITAGSPAPAASRAATYLHPNAPRLLLFVALVPSGSTPTRHHPELILGGLLVDSATGEVRWSGRTSARTAGDDQGLRLLTDKLVRSLTALTPR